MSGVPYHSSDIGGFYGSQQPTPELYCAGCRPRCSARTSASTASASASRGRSAPRPRRSPQVARVPLPPDPVSAAGDRRGGRDRHAGDARDGARVSRQRAHPRLRNAVHVRRRAAGRADHPRRRRGRGRAAAGRLVRPQFAAALPRPARAALQGGARPVPGVRARRLRVAAGPRGPAYRRDRRRESARAAVGVRPADAAARRLRAGATSRGRPTAHSRSARRPTSRSSFSATRPGSSSHAVARDARARPTPDRGHRAANRPASARSSSRCSPCVTRAPIPGAARHRRRPRLADGARRADRPRAAVCRLRCRVVRAGRGGIEIWHQPMRGAGDAGPSRPDQRAQRAGDAAARVATPAPPACFPRW